MMGLVSCNTVRVREIGNMHIVTGRVTLKTKTGLVWPASWGGRRRCLPRPWIWCRCCSWGRGPWSAGPRGLYVPPWGRWRRVCSQIRSARAAWIREGWACGASDAGPPPGPVRTRTLGVSSPTIRPRATVTAPSSSPLARSPLLHRHYVTPLFWRYRHLETALTSLSLFKTLRIVLHIPCWDTPILQSICNTQKHVQYDRLCASHWLCHCQTRSSIVYPSNNTQMLQLSLRTP